MALSGTTPVSTRLDVRSFGAKGDGVTDDSTAINAGLAALATMGGGTLYFPGSGGSPAVYLIKAAAMAITGDNITVRGDGPTLSTIKMGNSASVQRLAVLTSRTNIAFIDLGFDGNFINQSYPAATVTAAIDGTSSVRARVNNCRFHAFGYVSAADAPYANCIYLPSSLSAEVNGCVFVSNLATEINLNAAASFRVTNNTLGSPNRSESLASTNWWDSYSGGFGIFTSGASNGYFSGNRMFGCHRAFDGSDTVTANGAFINVYGQGGAAPSSDIDIKGNVFNGLGNGLGTVSVTNGSGTVTGVNTQFHSLHVGTFFTVEGDGTTYKITARASRTSITVSPVIARATLGGLKYNCQYSGDAIGVTNTHRFTISGNVVTYSGDNGFDILSSGASQTTGEGIFTSNYAAYCAVDGLAIQGAVFNVLVGSNSFRNGCQQGVSGHAGAIDLSQTSTNVIWHVAFSDNVFLDDQATTTQTCAFQVNGDKTKVVSCSERGSRVFGFGTPGTTLFDSGTTATQWVAVVNYPTTFTLPGVPTFADNASALTGGLTIGTPYRITGSDHLAIVH